MNEKPDLHYTNGTPRSTEELEEWDGTPSVRGANDLEHPGRRVFKTHAQVTMNPWAGGVQALGKAKVIVVVRNPKDTCVSLFHHSKDTPGFDYEGDMDHFITSLFLQGKVESGCFWAWHAGWWKAYQAQPFWKQPGIYWVSYEDLFSRPEIEIGKLAKFLDISASDEVIERVTDLSSFSSMKEAFTMQNQAKLDRGFSIKPNHIRTGGAGKWKKSITGASLTKFDEVDKDKTAKHGFNYSFTYEG